MYSYSWSYEPKAKPGHDLRSYYVEIGDEERARKLSRNNKDINWSKTKDNLILKNIYEGCTTERTFQKAREEYVKSIEFESGKSVNSILEEYNESQYRDDRKKDISDLFNVKGIQEHSMIYQIGNEDFHPEDRQKVNNIYSKLFEDLDKTEGIQITEAAIHWDEKTPHLHISFFSITEEPDKKRGVKLSGSFDRTCKNQNGSFEDFRENQLKNIFETAEENLIRVNYVARNHEHQSIWQYKKNGPKYKTKLKEKTR